MAQSAVSFTPDDFNAAVMAVAGEAANQPAEGQAAVASTMLNRSLRSGKPIRDIASDTSQYNAINAKAVPGTPLYDAIAPNIAPVFTNGPSTDATHYLNPELQTKLGRKQPSWAGDDGTRIGDHVFYNRADLIDQSPPSADAIEAHALSPQPPVVPVDVAELPALPDQGPTSEEIEALLGHPRNSPKPQTPAQAAAGKDAGQLESILSAALARLTTDDRRYGGKGVYDPGVDLVTPTVHGASQGFLDEVKGAGFGAATGARNVVLNALGKPVPYGMADASAAETAAARTTLRGIEQAHPVSSTAAEITGAAAPWVAGGELLAGGKAAVEAPTALGRLAQYGGRIVKGAATGSALGATGGAVSGFANAEGDAEERSGAAGEGAFTGAALGLVAGGGLPAVAPMAGAAAHALGAEGAAATGAVGQAARNVVGRLQGQPVETTAAEYFASRSPTAQHLQSTFAAPEAAEAVVPTEAETRLAQQRVVQMMAAKGMHADDLRLLATDIPHTTAEAIGSQTVNHAASLARRAGTTPDLAAGQIAERHAGFGSAVLDDFASASGIHPEDAAGDIEKLTTRLKGEADPLFAAVRAHEGPVWNADLATLAQRPVIAKAIDAAAKDMLNAGKSPTAAGFEIDPDTGLYRLGLDMSKGIEHQPTAETWENIRQRIGDQVERHPLSNKILPDSQSRGNFNINVAKQDLTTALAGEIPGYRDALAKSADYLSVGSAFKRGKETLLNQSVSAREFAKLYNALNEPEKKAWAAGVANRLYEQTQTPAGLRPSVLKADILRDKIRTVLGTSADEFLDRAGQRVRLQATGQRIAPGAGSQSMPLLQASEETAPVVNAFGEVIKEAAHAKASPVTFVMKHAAKAATMGDRAANVAETPGYRNEYGRILLQHPRQTADELRAHPPQPPRKVKPLRIGPATALGGRYLAPQTESRQ